MKTTAIVDIVCAVFIGILYTRNIPNRKISKSGRLLNICLAVMLVSLLIDAAAYSFLGPSYPVAFRFFINLLSFVGSCVNVILFTVYAEALFNEKGKVNPWYFRIIKVVETIWAFATAYEFTAGHLITYGTDGVENLDYVFPTYIVIVNLAVQLYLVAITLINLRTIGKNLAILLSTFFIAPLLSSVLFDFLGVDYAYAFGAIMLGLVAEFIQKNQTKQMESEKQKRLQAAMDAANVESQRVKMINAIMDSADWIYEIDANDNVVAAQYGDVINRKVDADSVENPMLWVDLVHPEDKERVLAGFMAAIYDHTGKTTYDEIFRLVDRDGNYRWSRSVGEVLRRKDGTSEYVGMSMDMTKQMEEQQKRLLGAMPLSNDVLAKANIGMWAFELDEGNPPRMYDDETMLGLVGLDHQVPPEEAYHAWYDHIDEASYDLVNDAVNKMIAGEHAEVQYPWHFPDGRTIIVRCGGIRNYAYTKGIRIEGTHQDVTETLHFDEEERQRAKKTERDLILSKLRADSLAFIEDNEPDLNKAINFFGKKILDISGCDQVVYRELDGQKLVLNAPGYEEVPENICSECPFSKFDCAAFNKDGTVRMNDCRLGYEGIMAHPNCPAKSSFMQMVYSGGNVVGKLTVHYLNDYHTFNENGIEIMKTVAIYLGLLIGRIKEKQSEIARIEAESANKAKTEFLFNMSHDIRTPMNAIIGFTNMAQKHIEDRNMVTDCLSKLKSSGEYMLSLLNDILDMAKIDQGKFEIENDEVVLADLVQSLENIVKESAEEKQLEIDFNYDELHEGNVWADSLHLRRIMMNIISNAIKYTKPGGHIKVNLRELLNDDPEKGIYEFTVEDNGIGMTPDFVKHIFEQFERERNSTTSGIQGTGLGMAITKNLVECMNGTISVESELGKGSKFTVVLPLKYNKGQKRGGKKSSETETVKMRFDGMRILLAEDNLLNREIALDVLCDLGVVVEEAEDGAVAVEKVAGSKPGYYHLVLMDIQMPYMDGYQATKVIRNLENPELANIPIYALSANVYSEDRKKSADAGMNGHLGKPLEINELLHALTKYAPKDAGRIISDEEKYMKPEAKSALKSYDFDENKCTILITDDSEINRKFLGRMLRDEYIIVEAQNGKEALEILRKGEKKIHLVLMDLSMPVMNGFEFMEEWKNDGTIAHIPVMVQTAGSGSDGEALSLRLGASDYIKRPYQSEVVLHRIANVIKKQQNSN